MRSDRSLSADTPPAVFDDTPTSTELPRSAVAIGMVTMGYGPRYLGGAEHQAALLATELARRGRRIVLYAPSASTDAGRISTPNIRIIPVPSLGFPRTRTATYLPLLALLQNLPGLEHPAILHSHMAWYHAVVPQLARRLVGTRTVVKFACSGADGDIATLSRSALGRFALRRLFAADRVVALTPAVADELVRAGFPRTRVRLIPNGARMGEEAHEDIRSLDRPGPTVLFAGRLTKQKGILEFLDAWHVVPNSVPNATLIIAGVGPLENAIRKRVALADIRGTVSMVGHQPQIGDLLQSTDAVVIPSRSEGMSNVALEALASSRPVFGFAIPGVEDVVVDRRALSEPGNHDNLAAKLASGLRSPALLDDLRLSGYERVRAQFSIERVGTLYEQLYAELCD